MKKYLSLLFVIILFDSCGNDNETQSSTTYLKTSKAFLEYKPIGGEDFLDITSDGKWTISNIPNWCSVDHTNGEGNKTIKVTTSVNDSGKDREGYLIINADTIVRKISIYQDIKDPSFLKLSQPILDFSAHGGDATFEIDTDGRWIIEDFDASWLAVDQMKGKKKSNVIVSVIGNDLEKNREVKLRIIAGNYNNQITIVQNFQKSTHLDISKKELKFEHIENELSFEINTDGFWNISEIPNWCSALQDKGCGKTVVKLLAKANETLLKRSAEIKITAGNFTAKVALIQASYIPDNGIYVQLAGNLKQELNKKNLLLAEDIVVFGELNETDFETIRNLLKIKSIDLRNTKFITLGKELPSDAFHNSPRLETVFLPEGITIVCGFDYCKSLVNVTIPSTVKDVSGFSHCDNLASIVIPDGVESIRQNAFSYCYKLENIKLPTTIKTIGVSAFQQSGIKNIVLPPQLEKISEATFKYSQLESIIIPDNIKEIGDEAFYSCKLKSINIGKGVTVLPVRVFAFNNELIEVNIPDNVTTIIGEAFYRCQNLERIIIGKNIKDIYPRAFATSSNLKKISIKATTPPFLYSDIVGPSEFSTVSIYVPKSALNTYKNDISWMSFKNIYGE